MKIAYLILAHKQPQLLLRLISRLTDTHVKFFVHIDTGSNIAEFEEVLGKDPQIELLTKHRTFWGSFNIVRAELLLIKKAYSWGADRVVLLSGQDYPIKSAQEIRHFFSENSNTAFIESTQMPNKNWTEHQHGLFRINRFHFRFSNKWRAMPPHSKKHILNQLFNFLAHLTYVLFFKSVHIPAYWHGSQWWSLNRNHLAYILNKAPFYVKGFKNSYAADELFFQSIIANALGENFSLVPNDLHYIKWPKNESSSPLVLQADDFDVIKNSNKLFIRKVDEDESNKLLNKIDKEIKSLNKESVRR